MSVRTQPRVSRCRFALAVWFALIAMGGDGTARAAEGPPWLRIDRVKAEPSLFEGLARVQLFVTAVDLRGMFMADVTGNRAWQLRLGQKRVRTPYIAGTFQGVEDELVVGLVIATTVEFTDALPAVKEQAIGFVRNLPRSARLLVLGYDEEVHGGRRTTTTSRAVKLVEELEAASAPAHNQLITAVDRVERALARAKRKASGHDQRQVIVVISDGRDVEPVPERFRKLSKRAGRHGIPIHTIAYAPDGNRYPLLGMAELSKHSQGTFRFARTENSFESHFAQLLSEIQNQYVLTYYLPDEELKGKRLQIAAPAHDLESKPVRVSAIVCGGETCSPDQYCAAQRCVVRPRVTGLSVLAWVAIVGGALVGLLALLTLAAVVASWRQRRQAARAAAPAQQVEVAANAPAHPHRIVPQGPQGGLVDTSNLPHGRASSSHAAQPAVRAPSSNPYGQPPARGAAYPPTLLVLNGHHRGQRIPLHHGFLIGKDPGCHLLLSDDHFASGQHAQILMDKAGGCTLVDQGSTNGTFINGVRTTQTRLAHGMLIKMGSTETRFLTG